MTLTFVSSTRKTEIIRIAAQAAAAVRRWHQSTNEAQQLRASRKVVAYLRNLDNERLRNLGIERPEIERRFASTRQDQLSARRSRIPSV